jgi:hypothetical protein
LGEWSLRGWESHIVTTYGNVQDKEKRLIKYPFAGYVFGLEPLKVVVHKEIYIINAPFYSKNMKIDIETVVREAKTFGNRSPSRVSRAMDCSIDQVRLLTPIFHDIDFATLWP